MYARTRKQAHTGEYVILIAFPQQQWFRERTSVLRHTYISSRFNPVNIIGDYRIIKQTKKETRIHLEVFRWGVVRHLALLRAKKKWKEFSTQCVSVSQRAFLCKRFPGFPRLSW
jgi:hypothetical protein